MSYAEPECHLIETERLIIRELDAEADGEFIFDLLNQPSFIRFIGDRGVRSVADARDFVENRYRQSYRDHGFGLYAVELRTDRTPVGICGFVRREGLDDPDIGFAFLPQFEGRGFAFEAAAGVLNYGRDVLGIRKVMAITTPNNESSIRLLGKLEFKFLERVTLPGNDDELNLFVRE